jgi:7-keto-8-aminopelargonate synthetase-like enzyme
MNGRESVNFASSNYLGLEQHPEVLYASKRAIDELGTETGCPREISSQQNIVDLEATLSQMLAAEATLIGTSAAQVNSDSLAALFGEPESILFLDRHAQDVVVRAAEAAGMKGAEIVRVDVGDLLALQKALLRHGGKRGALVVDSLYGIQGSMPDFKTIERLCPAAGIVLYVDDTHGIGVLGASGGGVAEACGLGYDNLLVVGSLQTAFGTYGGFISGKAPLVDFLRVMSPSYAAGGTLQPAAVEGALASVRIARSSEGRRLRQQLADSSQWVRDELESLGFSVVPGYSPVISVKIGKDMKTLMAARKLFDLGVFVPAYVFPSVDRGRGVLRISLTALHTKGDLAKLVEAFRALRAYLLKYENPMRQAAHLAYELCRSRWQGQRYAGIDR